MSRFYVKLINKYLAAQGKALPGIAESIFNKDASQLSDQEREWYRENIVPHERFFIDVLKALYAQEKKPEKWLKKLGEEGKRTIVAELAVKSLRELGISVPSGRETVPVPETTGLPGEASFRGAEAGTGAFPVSGQTPPYTAPPPIAVSIPAYVPPPPPEVTEAVPVETSVEEQAPPTAEGPPEWAAAPREFPPPVPESPATVIIPPGARETATPAPVEPPGWERVTPPPPEVTEAVPVETPVEEQAPQGWEVPGEKGLEEIRDTFSLQAGGPTQGHGAYGMDIMQPGGQGMAGISISTGSGAESTESGMPGHTSQAGISELPPVIDYRQAWERTEEARPQVPIVDHRYELERGPGVPVLYGSEVVEVGTFPQEEAPRPSRGFKGWLAAHKVLAGSIAAFLVLAGMGVFLLFLLLGGEKVIYEWSISQRVGKMVRVERQLALKKNSKGHPYLYTVTVKFENVGDESIKEIRVEEEIPPLLLKKGDMIFHSEPDKESEGGERVGWIGKRIGKSESFEVSYSLPLQAELSGPQLEEIEEHFSKNIIAGIFLPENFETCPSCNGQGSTTCQVCSGMGTVTCPRCGGVGYITCPVCGGQGKVTCSRCGGDGGYYQCPVDGTIVQGYYDNCPTCGRSWMNMPYRTCSACGGSGKVTCTNCGGTGRARCPTCGGTMRVPCSSCGGTGKISCSTCGGDGLVPIKYGEVKLFQEEK